MANCPDFCSAAKCAELERRVSALEQALELLEASFEAHTNQEIPAAHNYYPNVNVEAAISDKTLAIDVSVDDQSDVATVNLPDDDVTVSLAANSSDNTLKVFVKVGNKSDDETVTLPEPEVTVSLAANSDDNTLKVFVEVGSKNDDETITLPEPRVNVEADVYDGTLAIDVTVGNQSDVAIVTLPKPKEDDWLDLLKDLLLDLLKDLLSNLLKDFLKDLVKDLLQDLIEDILDLLKNRMRISISGSYNGYLLELTVSNGLSSDSTRIRIPRGGGGGGGGEEEPFSLGGFADYNVETEILTISISGGGSSATFQTEIPMCDLTKLERLVEEIHEYTVIDITGETPTAFLCPEPENKESEIKPTLLPYTGKGLIGLHELTKTFNNNLLAVFGEICQLEIDAVTSFPEGWQIKKGQTIPQLAIIFRPADKNNKSGNYLTHIPHYNGDTKPSIPSYTKGDYWARWRLTDNSHILVFASSKAESLRVIRSLERYVESSFRTKEAPGLVTGQASTGTYKTLKVDPVRADYYPVGKAEVVPKWRYYFKP